MEVQTIEVDRAKALELYRSYQQDRHYQDKTDKAIARIYRHLSNGKVIIRALDSIASAGVNDEGLPKLAIANATAQICGLRYDQDGAARMWRGDRRHNWRDNTNTFRWPAGTFPNWTYGSDRRQFEYEALVPLVPVHLRPKRALDEYHVLFEAEWSRRVPVDPMLLRRIPDGGDTWVVVAAWDLTAVERAVLSARLSM